MHGEFTQGGCYARWTDGELTLGNTEIERRWRIADGQLVPLALTDRLHGVEWIATPPETPAQPPAATITAAPELTPVMAAPGVKVTVTSGTLITELTVFPEASAIRLCLRTDGAALPDDAVFERFTLAHAHLRLRQVHFADQTDFHNELVQEREWLLHPSEQLALSGNLFILEDPFTGNGLIVLKEAPLPHARPCPAPCDLMLGRAELALHGHGMGGGVAEGYPVTLLTCGGGRRGVTAALHRYQRALRAFDPARDGRFLANTWGDRSQDTRVNEAFMLAEVEAGARLGVDVIQIDDGWEAGCTINSAEAGGVWDGFWAADAGFWQPHPDRFPRGLAPVIDRARELGLQFGLWFVPDSADDFANWERDADLLLGLHRAHGVNYFKIDGVKAVTRLGEMRLHRFFDKVLADSAGAVVFDLDITAEIRPGYFGLMQTGPLFVENRYTDWHNYWPHQTLRNLWMLAHYIDPARLRIEFLNNARNAGNYPDDPLAPARYAPDYLFAITMAANPLGWCEVSNLPEDYRAAVAPLAAIWKTHRTDFFTGQLLPIGAPPDGAACTGFASVKDGRAYLLLFRELTDTERWPIDLPLTPTRVTRLAGHGSVNIVDGRLHATLPTPLSYGFFLVE